MPAKNTKRIDSKNLYFHIFNKGLERRIIFKDQEDFAVFLGYLNDYLNTPKDPTKQIFQIQGRSFQGVPHQPKNYFNKVELIAYCLMPDHFHLALHQLAKGSVEKFIRSLCTRYSIYFNKKYNRSGPLFAGPYKSIQIEVVGSLLSHLTGFFHYKSGYSSYPEYLGTRNTPWVKTKEVLALFSEDSSKYKAFVEQISFENKTIDEQFMLEKETDHQIITHTKDIKVESKPLPKTPFVVPRFFVFIALSIIGFILLVSVGLTNIQIAQSKTNLALSIPTQQVLAATNETLVENSDPAASKSIVTVKIEDSSESVNIRQKPTTSSKKIGEAKDGDTFDYISLDSGWYEVKLTDELTGYISAQYIETEPTEGANQL